MLSGQQHVEKHAQCVDVGPGRHGPAGHLFRRGVLGRERPPAVARQRRRFSGAGFLLEKLRDAEIEELHLPVSRRRGRWTA